MAAAKTPKPYKKSSKASSTVPVKVTLYLKPGYGQSPQQVGDDLSWSGIIEDSLEWTMTVDPITDDEFRAAVDAS